MNKKEIYNEIVGAFEEKYSWLGKQFVEEALYSVASWNIQQFSNPDFRVRRHLLLFWPPGFIKTVGENEKILINDRYVPIKDLDERGKLTTISSYKGKIYGNKINTPYIKSPLKKEKTFEIETIGNYNVVAGQDHPFMVITKKGNIEWRKTKELKENDILVMAKPDVSNKYKSERMSDEARLIGYLIGDGSYCSNNVINFTNENKIILDDYEKLVKKYLTNKPIKKYKKKGTNSFDYRINSKEIRTLLYEKYGLDYVTSKDKTIPIHYDGYYCNKKHIENILFGLYQTDGGCGENSIYFSSISINLLNQIKELLLIIGISSRTYTTKGNKFCLYINGKTNLKKLPLFLKSKHGEKIRKIINRDNPASETIPFASKIILNELKKRKENGYSNSIRKQFKKVKLIRNNFYGKESKNKKYFLKTIKKLKLKELKWLAHDNIFFEKIRYVKPNGIKNCYDLFVPKTNTFICNGFYTHNSTLLMKFREILGHDVCGHLSDVTTAAIRGSVDSGKFRVPICLKNPITMCTEFGQMVNGDSNELIQKLLNILEEGEVTVSLVKAGGLLPAEREKAIEKYGIEFDDDNNFTYKTNWILMAGTYNKKFLSDSALESRFIVMTPEKKLDGDLTKHIHRSKKFEVSEEAKIGLKDEMISKWNIGDYKPLLPDEVYSPELNMSIRDSAGLLSKMMAKKWWGFEMSKDEIIDEAKRIKQSSKDVWDSDEDKVFDCIFFESKSVKEIAEETGITYRQVMRYLRNIRATRILKDGENVYRVI